MDNSNNYNHNNNKKRNYYYKHNKYNHYHKYNKYNKYNKYYKYHYYKHKNKKHNNNNDESSDNILLAINNAIRNINSEIEEKEDNLELISQKEEDVSEIVGENMANKTNNVMSNQKVSSSNDKSNNFLYVLKFTAIIIALIVFVFGVSYAAFNYSRKGSSSTITTADMYVLATPSSHTSMTLNKLYPRTDTEARARSDNYIDITVAAKNATTKALTYSIDINNGPSVSGKSRIDAQYIKVDLQEKINGNYTYLKNAVSLSNYTFSVTVPANTTTEISREFRLRIWVGDNVLISDTDNNRTHTQAQFANLFANYKIEVNSNI